MDRSSPGPHKTHATADPLARLQLEQALRRAKYAIAWERLWPTLARLLTVIGLFLVASWVGLWLWLPSSGRAIGLALFVLLALAALAPLIWFRWPSRIEALTRLDRGTGIRHRPATTLTDTLASQDPVAQTLWRVQRERTLASIRNIKAGLPSPRLAIHDPWALRALVVVLLVATAIAAGGDRRARIAAAFDWQGVLAPANVRLDAWVAPPAYTNRPPIILSGAVNAQNAQTTPNTNTLQVPAGSTLVVRASGGRLDVLTSGGITEAAADDKPPPAGTEERRYTIAADGVAQVRAPSGLPSWRFAAVPDRGPSISLAKDPERQARGSLLMSYKLEDDYGVTEAHATFAARNSDSAAQAARPLFAPPDFPLVLPNARTRNGVGQTVKDLTEHPYAGADLRLTLRAKDEAGNEGTSAPFDMRMPERLFVKPLARSLIEQRRNLALDANKRDEVKDALDALMIEPEQFTPELGHYLGMRTIYEQLTHAKADDDLKEVVGNLWALAVTIEDGNISDVERALRAAQEALRQALERGASDEEIKKLTDQLRAALDNFMRQLAEQLRNNPQQLARPLDPNTRVMRQDDLRNMIDRMERMSRSGDKDAAKQLLDQMQQMLENLQMAQPGQGGDDMEQALNELGDVIRKQQQLRDRTFKEGQDSRRQRGQRGGEQNDNQNGMGDLQQDQQALRDRLQSLLDQLGKQGMRERGQGQKGEKGQPGQQGQQGQQGQGQGQGQGEDGDSLGDADNAMGDAGNQLGDGNADGAVGSQGRALEALRRGAQNLAQQLQQGQGDGNPNDNGPSNQVGRQQNSGPNADPLGRPLRGREFSDDFSVKIPGEIDVQRVRRILEELRRRFSDPERPQLELDYLERLLKDF
ncbi:TIGR02302 family protein [Bradyrhizobium sp. LHD-71]|uniref:TIGR02302 family protein n=1 Tax=Bradyrhizobium sp. LHD-71 TaxID=3072141 RepID=UPI00280CD1BE|nr:TIGR02302 family protein [Bradyrhizobium sp. LHD-71]MDQ8730581.1 TIGR02302 family protein [Bradyrhizobium sp. LHD-71]